MGIESSVKEARVTFVY